MCKVAEGVSKRRAGTITRRFDEYGCSERFELVEIIDGSHVFVRCKECGHQFTRHTTFLNSSKSHNIECRACGIHADGTRTSPQSENKRGMDESVVVDYYLQGHSATQAALKFGMILNCARMKISASTAAMYLRIPTPLSPFVYSNGNGNYCKNHKANAKAPDIPARPAGRCTFCCGVFLFFYCCDFFIGHTLSADQKPVGVHPKGCTGHKRHHILVRLNAK